MSETPIPTNPTSTSSLASYMAQFGGLTGTGVPTSDPTNPNIYLGSFTASSTDLTPHGFGSQSQSQDKVTTLNDMLHEFEQKSGAEQHRIATLLAIGGFAGSMGLDQVKEWVEGASLADVMNAYAELLGGAANRFEAKVTPDALLKKAVAFRLKGAGVSWDGKLSDLSLDGLSTGLAESSSLAGTKSQTTSSLDFMDPQDAKALTRGMLQQELGRDPTKGEYEDFLAMIHQAEKHDPSTSTTTYTTDVEGNVTDQNTVTHQGMTAAGVGQMVQDKAQRQPGWAEWQAMGTYAPALFQALGASVPGV